MDQKIFTNENLAVLSNLSKQEENVNADFQGRLGFHTWNIKETHFFYPNHFNLALVWLRLAKYICTKKLGL